MLSRLAVGPSLLAAVTALAIGAAPAEAQRLSLSPTIGVYIPTSDQPPLRCGDVGELRPEQPAIHLR